MKHNQASDTEIRDKKDETRWNGRHDLPTSGGKQEHLSV
jgi:hypothetical protein